jgi:centromeric protein E
MELDGAKIEEARVSVSIRIRPMSARERESGSEEVWRAVDDLPGHIHLVDGGPANTFAYDNVFAPATSTRQIYECVGKPLAISTVEGFNGTIFAYGQVS